MKKKFKCRQFYDKKKSMSMVIKSLSISSKCAQPDNKYVDLIISLHTTETFHFYIVFKYHELNTFFMNCFIIKWWWMYYAWYIIWYIMIEWYVWDRSYFIFRSHQSNAKGRIDTPECLHNTVNIVDEKQVSAL